MIEPQNPADEEQRLALLRPATGSTRPREDRFASMTSLAGALRALVA